MLPKNYYALIVILIVLIFIGYFFNNNTNKIVKEVRPLGEEIFTNLYERNFNIIQNKYNFHFDYEHFFTGEGIINYYKESGYGTNGRENVWLHYYVTGLPAETRNVSLNFQKENSAWNLSDIKISYHFDRVHKSNIFSFINHIEQGNRTEAFALTRDFSKDKFEEIASQIPSVSFNSNWEIVEAINKPCSNKYCKNKPSAQHFYVMPANGYIKLFFICKDLKGDCWIEKVSLIALNK